jgi:hypothetical protein
MEECTGDDWYTERFSWIDYSVFAVTLSVSIGIGIFYGFFSKGKQRTTAEFLMGDQQINAISLSISLTVGYVTIYTSIFCGLKDYHV